MTWLSATSMFQTNQQLCIHLSGRGRVLEVAQLELHLAQLVGYGLRTSPVRTYCHITGVAGAHLGLAGTHLNVGYHVHTDVVNT